MSIGAKIWMAVLVGMVTIGQAAIAQGPKKYDLSAKRPQKVGHAFHTTMTNIDATTTVVLSAEGMELNRMPEQTTLELVAVWEVLAIDEDGEPTSSRLTVERFRETVGDAASDELLPPGSVLQVTNPAEGEEEVEALLDGKPLPDDLRQPLKDLMVITTRDSSEPDWDELFGTDIPRAVGESWAVPKEALAKFLKSQQEEEVTFDLDKTKATISVKELEQINGLECLRVAMDIRLGGMKLLEEVPMFRVLSMESSVTAEQSMPVDPKELPPLSVMSMTMDFEMTGIEGDVEGLLADVHAERRLTVRVTDEPPHVMRTWNDATGNFSVVAKLVEAGETEVQLKRANGTTISVPLGKLSAADRAYVSSLEDRSP